MPDLHENVYMKVPLGYNGLGCRLSQNSDLKSPPNLVCKLKKSFNGLKQKPRSLIP